MSNRITGYATDATLSHPPAKKQKLNQGPASSPPATQHRLYGGLNNTNAYAPASSPTTKKHKLDQRSLGLFALTDLNNDCLREIVQKLDTQDRANLRLAFPKSFTGPNQPQNNISILYSNKEIGKICLKLIRNIIDIESELLEIENKTHRFSNMPELINKDKLESTLTTLTNRLNMFFNLFGDTLDLSNTTITDDELKTLINTIPKKTLAQIKNINLSKCSRLTALPNLSQLTSLTNLDLTRCSGLTDDGIQLLSHLTRLTNLNLSYCNGITNDGIQALSQLTSLQTLSLSECSELTDEGIQALSQLTKLQTLNLAECSELTDEGIQTLSQLTRLTELNLWECSGLTDEGIQTLSKLTRLTKLYLGGCSGLTDEGIQTLSKLTRLTELYLRGCSALTALPDLSKLTRLTCLYLEGCSGLTALPNLSHLTKLQTLYLAGCSRLTDSGIQALQEKCSDLRIIRY